MAASRSSRVTRSSVGLNGLDENFCGRTLRNRSIAQPDEASVSQIPRARSPKKKQESKHDSKQDSRQDTKPESKQDAKHESKQDAKHESKQEPKQDTKHESKQDAKHESKQDAKHESKQDAKHESKQDAKQDAKHESKQDAKHESKQDAKHESKQDAKHESKQDAKPESKQDAKPESKQDAKPESKQDAKPESKQDAKPESKQDAKHESKQDAKHESKQKSNDIKQGNKQDSIKNSNADSDQESKHGVTQDTKPQETCLQDSQQQDLLQGNVTDSIVSPGDADQSAISRKRVASCLENDISQEKLENSDPVKELRDASPHIKRAKRCSRSGESQGQKEDQSFFKPDSPASVPELCKDVICEELASNNSSNPAPPSPVLRKQEGDVMGRKGEEDSQMECDGVVLPPNSHKASNGLRDTDADESSTLTEQPSANPTSATNFLSLLNGSQMGAPSFPDPSVPFRNSIPEQREASGSGESSASSAPTFEGAPEDPVPDLIVAKEQEVEEVEVDVVGDPLCLAHEEQVMLSDGDTNGRPPSPVQDAAASTSSTLNINCSSINNSNSGETTPLLTTPPSPTEPGCNPSISSMSPSFTELYEHRYTLRTSPRRVVSGCKASTSKPNSPLTDNGPLREGVEVEEDCPMVEDPVCSESVGLLSEELVSANPEHGAGDEDDGFMEDKETKSSKELIRSQAAEEEEEEEEPDVYYFESDHLALKHNKDYQRLLQTIVVLEAQRTQAILDLETLAGHQRGALANPISFVEQLQKQVSLGLPCPQRVVQLPDIAWDQYTSGLGDFEREFCDKKRKTRQLKLIFDKGLPLRPKSPVEPKKEGECSTMYSSLPTSDAPENSSQTQMIRGRICQPNKPDTFNQLWTVEEQKKLEQLLVKYPPEEVESKRWQKIADDLGNRTAKQVASRVQKYFIKLTKAGIPVPGRTPNLCMYTKKASSKRQHHLNKHLYRPSTFLTSYEPPVYMDEEDERSSYYNSVQDPSADDSDEESVPVELRSLPEYKELLELKRLKKQKLQEIHEEKDEVQHLGYKCDVCGMEPIQGVRWHCQDCPPENSVDFCSNCSDCLFKTETHKPNHHLEPVYRQETFLDRDYCLPQSTGYNYLDPNYFPANR